ncbi:Inner membrane protein yohK, partial [Dysosmobacter welbionis]
PEAAKGPQGVEPQVVDVKGPAHQQLPALNEPRDTQARGERAFPRAPPPQQGGEKAKGQEHDQIPRQDVTVAQGPEGNQIDSPRSEEGIPLPVPAAALKQVRQGLDDPSGRQGHQGHAAAEHPEEGHPRLPDHRTGKARGGEVPPAPGAQAPKERQGRHRPRCQRQQVCRSPSHGLTRCTSGLWHRRAEPGPSPSPAGPARPRCTCRRIWPPPTDAADTPAPTGPGPWCRS